MRPSSTPEGIASQRSDLKNGYKSAPYVRLKDGGCPENTVPIRRYSKKERAQANSLSRNLINQLEPGIHVSKILFIYLFICFKKNYWACRKNKYIIHKYMFLFREISSYLWLPWACLWLGELDKIKLELILVSSRLVLSLEPQLGYSKVLLL